MSEPLIRKVRPDELEALVGCGFRIGAPTLFMARRESTNVSDKGEVRPCKSA